MRIFSFIFINLHLIKMFSYLCGIINLKLFEMLTLENLKGLNKKEIVNHLISNYSGEESGFDYGNISEKDKVVAKQKLKGMNILVAYESVGDYGCDSSSYFLLKDKEDRLFEVRGAHCSCYGFEGQLNLEETTLETIKMRLEKGSGVFYTGGYDDNSDENLRLAKEYVYSL